MNMVKSVNGLDRNKIYIFEIKKNFDEENRNAFVEIMDKHGIRGVLVQEGLLKILEPIGIDKEELKKLLGKI